MRTIKLIATIKVNPKWQGDTDSLMDQIRARIEGWLGSVSASRGEIKTWKYTEEQD